uniref:protein-tyrosine-phosphatase n=1 Tax=Chelydra serpentina TaxID=8475 RepID=A0A8C3SXP2_CHESE
MRGLISASAFIDAWYCTVKLLSTILYVNKRCQEPLGLSLPSNCSLSGPLNGECPALREPCFWDINECIEASLEKRKRVLIHCLDGYSLAPTCVIQYLMVKHNMRLMAAYEFVRARYPLNIRDRSGVWDGLSIRVTLRKSLWTRITGREPPGTPRCVSVRS